MPLGTSWGKLGRLRYIDVRFIIKAWGTQARAQVHELAKMWDQAVTILQENVELLFSDFIVELLLEGKKKITSYLNVYYRLNVQSYCEKSE